VHITKETECAAPFGNLLVVDGRVLFCVFYQFPEISLRLTITVTRVWNFTHWLLVFVAKFYISKLQVTIIGADFIISLIFTILTDLKNKTIQEPYQNEARQAMEGMKRVWQEGDPKPTSFLFDLFGGGGVQNITMIDALCSGLAARARAHRLSESRSATFAGDFDVQESAHFKNPMTKQDDLPDMPFGSDPDSDSRSPPATE
jgi:hypothetical protein